MKWREVKIFTTKESLPAISNILQDIGIEGLVKEDLEVKGSDDDLLIKAYLPINDSLEAKLAILKSKIGYLHQYGLNSGSGRIELETIPEEDWSSSWKEHFKPTKITDTIVIKPTWEEYEAKPGEKIIELDPGMAFGTGAHATTTMCIEAIEENCDGRENMLDIGTGTGILSVAASLLEIEDILAIDIDDIAVKIAKQNLKLNNLDEEVVVKQGDLVEIVNEKYDLVVGNLLPHIILRLIPDMLEVLDEDSIFILSGINKEKKEEIKEALIDVNLIVKEVKEEEDWVTIIGERS